MERLSGLADRLADRRVQREIVVGATAALAAIAALTAVLLPLRAELGLLNVGLLYLLLVVVLAARWGWTAGLLASVAANLAFNYFFVPPRFRFTVQEPASVLALGVFLGVAALTSTLVGRARAGEAAARRRAEESAVLYDLSRLIIITPDTAETLRAICARVQSTFESDACTVFARSDGRLAAVASSGAADARTVTAYERSAAEEAYTKGHTVLLGVPGRRRPRIVGIPDRRAPVAYLPLRAGATTVGVLEVVGSLRARVFTENDLRLLEAFADITALAVERERLLREAAGAEALKETDRLKSALLSAVSHDLRTPLAAIKAASSSLLDPTITFDDATHIELLTAIDEETDRLTRVVSNLLDLSRIEGGALRPDATWYDIRELLETVAARLDRTVTHHRLVRDLPADLGEASLDYVQIGQVVANLVENAAKFSPEGSEIRLSARSVPAGVEISVSDQGPGIPDEERSNIFEKFYRIRRTGQNVSGSGLGLAISKGLVEAHGGRIWVEDAPGGGARLVISLPRAECSVRGTSCDGRVDDPGTTRGPETHTPHAARHTPHTSKTPEAR